MHTAEEQVRGGLAVCSVRSCVACGVGIFRDVSVCKGLRERQSRAVRRTSYGSDVGSNSGVHGVELSGEEEDPRDDFIVLCGIETALRTYTKVRTYIH